MRIGVVALALTALVLAAPRPASAQFSTDARRIGMGGVSLQRDGNLRRYNSAYRAVKGDRAAGGGAKFTIPVPLGLIQFFKDHPLNQLGDDPTFNPESSAFNPVELMNVILNPPLFYEIKEAPTPTNDVEFTIGRNAFAIDLGAAQVLIPEDEFGLGGSSRLLDMGFGAMGFRFSVQGFEHHEVGFALDSVLRGFLKNADSARTNTTYSVAGDGIVQAGFAPTLSFSGRVTGRGDTESDDGIYLGAAIRSYYGVTYYRGAGPGGFTTGDTLFAGSNPVAPFLDVLTYRDNEPKKTFGRGFGGDIGVVIISGPLEIGLGVNDIGAELTWKDTKIERTVFDTAGDSLVTTPVANGVETRTKLPVSYIANAAFRMNTGTTVGFDIVNTGRGTVIHVGGEQRMGPLALRGGLSRDQRKKMQFGWGAGVRLGPIGLDAGFWTHSNSFSDERGITMATSISVY